MSYYYGSEFGGWSLFDKQRAEARRCLFEAFGGSKIERKVVIILGLPCPQWVYGSKPLHVVFRFLSASPPRVLKTERGPQTMCTKAVVLAIVARTSSRAVRSGPARSLQEHDSRD